MSSEATSTDNGDGGVHGYRYFVVISIGAVILISSISIASYLCSRSRDTSSQLPRRSRRRRPSQLPQDNNNNNNSLDIQVVGLDETTLKTYPKLLYSEAKLRNKHTITSTTSCCSICLADYKNTDTLRLLPDCGHLFHLKCVDPWLLQNPSCPVCRSSPIPTPLSTPLVETIALNSMEPSS